MIHYVLIDTNGEVVQRGTAQTLPEAPPIPGMRVEAVEPDDGRAPKGPPEPGYDRFRAMDYPPIGDQLDALWRVVQSLDLSQADPAALEVLEAVRAVKARHPKDAA